MSFLYSETVDWYIMVSLGKVRLAESEHWEKQVRIKFDSDDKFGHSFIGDWVGMVMVF